MTDRIEKQIELDAPVSRVWEALTDYRQFGEWFRVNLEEPFTPGKAARGHMTYPGYEHLPFEIIILKMDPERLFSYTWHPYAVDPNVDYSGETPTLVEFTLAERGKGTLLTVIETGFDKLPDNRRAEAYRKNEGGWEAQMKNIQNYLA